MKKVYLSLLVVFCTLPAWAQQRQAEKGIPYVSKSKSHLSEVGIRPASVAADADTLYPASLFDECSDSLRIITVTDNGGYVTGTNVYGDLEKLQKYGTDMPYELSSILVVVGYKSVAVATTEISGVVYGATEAGEPGALLGTSEPVTIEEADTTAFFTPFVFSTPVQLPDSFFVGITIPDGSGGDTIMVVSTKQGCYSGFQAAWEKQADGNFYPFNAGDGTWQLDVDMLIFPVISPIAASAKNLSAVYQPSIYPNPGNGRATLKYQLPKASEVSVTLRDVTGREVQRLAEGLQGAGNKQVELSLSNLNSGLYFYSIETPEGIASGKLNVVR